MTILISSEAGDNSPRQGLTWPRELTRETALLCDGFLYAMSSAQFCTGGSLRVVLCFSSTSLLFYSLHGQPSLFRPSLSWPLGISIIEGSTLRQDLASRVLAKCWSVFAGEHYFLCKNSPPSISQGKGIDNYFFCQKQF